MLGFAQLPSVLIPHIENLPSSILTERDFKQSIILDTADISGQMLAVQMYLRK